MVFASPIFLFVFLPLTLAVSVLLPPRLRNAWLLLASLVFYAWGELRFVLVILAAAVVNWGLGLAVARARGRPRARVVVALAVGGNVALLAVAKYAAFVVENANVLLARLGLAAVDLPSIALPLGISFFAFHAVSYLVDVHRGVVGAERSPLRVTLYFLMFPHLIAGPIVRYHHVARALGERRVELEQFALGVRRFVVGLAKKVLLADTLAVPADAIFALPPEELGPATAWLGVACYTLQIYFDFSGYSDMAIGLAHMLGFRFPENFAYPYVAQSIREFWRRWHISLSTWFRDYVFIPLGGSRRSAARVYGNLVTVFVLCGLWHGASWTFVVWGLWHGCFHVAERLGLARVLARTWRPLRHAYALLAVALGWVLFRADDLGHALAVYGALFGATGSAARSVGLHLDPMVAAALVAGVVGAMPLGPWSASWRPQARAWAFAEAAAVAAIFVLAAAGLAASTYNPFIYYRF